MQHLFKHLAFLCLSMGLTVASPARAAIPITLNTQWLDANGVLSLSSQAQQTLSLTGITVGAAGEAANLGGGRFNIPVTQLTAEVGLFSGVAAVNGQAYSSTLMFTNTLNGSKLNLSRLSIDFKDEVIRGRISYGGRIVDTTLFSFEPKTPLRFNLNFLTNLPDLTQSLGNLRLQQGAAEQLATGLGLPTFLSSALTTFDFGSLDAKVRPWFRKPVVSVVPEPSTWLSMGLGLIGLLVMTRMRAIKSTK